MGRKVDETLYDAVVIGGGPAGLTAAIYLARACYRVIVVEKEKFGGQITITAEVVNYPGTGPVSGSELTENMRRQAEAFGAEFMLAEVTSLDFSRDIKIVRTSRGNIRCLGAILATGAHPRMVGFRNEMEFRGHGVAYCATCDGEFFTGKEVFVIGGGFAAAEEAVFLTRYASHVTIMIRKDDFSCAKEAADEARSNPGITVLTNTTVEGVDGDSGLKSITYKNTKTGEVTTWSPEGGDTFGVFVFAGYEPSTELVKDLADLDRAGYVITDASYKTRTDGLYAAGDVCIKTLRQVVTATHDGAVAATGLEKYLSVMHEKTGLDTISPIKKSTLHTQQAMSAPAASKNIAAQEVKPAAASGSAAAKKSILTDDMITQLGTVFSRMQNPLVLEVHKDDGPISAELSQYMDELAALTDKLTVTAASSPDDTSLPFVRVLKADGAPAGITFHGVPGGHEFTSFVLGLYNASGPGQSVSEAAASGIAAISKKTHFDILVSLTCTMCPDLVTAAERIATLNPLVDVDVYDVMRFPALRKKYNVMSVPCFVINGSAPKFGKKSIDQLIELIV